MFHNRYTRLLVVDNPKQGQMIASTLLSHKHEQLEGFLGILLVKWAFGNGCQNDNGLIF
jgi:hypothetical protein